MSICSINRYSRLVMSVDKIHNLQWDTNGNKLPNFDDFVKTTFHEPAIQDVFELWQTAKRKCGYRIKDCTMEQFNHELGTLLIGCKEWSGSGSHGQSYGNLYVTTYQNNSIPNLYEFGVVAKW